MRKGRLVSVGGSQRPRLRRFALPPPRANVVCSFGMFFLAAAPGMVRTVDGAFAFFFLGEVYKNAPNSGVGCVLGALVVQVN